jgi:hypothetical protein
MHRRLILLERLHADRLPTRDKTFTLLDRLRFQIVAMINELRPVQLRLTSLNLSTDHLVADVAADHGTQEPAAGELGPARGCITKD